ncbi:MAG: YlbF family regulator, partial [Defluviitaleaceae bacterium]|nr:YlbF family regulator [Defluviitaleaceae bacterium]
MTIYYEKAMELGNMILSSETSLRLADAQAAFDEDAAASEHYMQYEERQESLQTAISGGLLNAEQYQ